MTLYCYFKRMRGISLRPMLHRNGTVIPPIANGNGTGQQDLVAGDVGVACDGVNATGYDARVTAAYDPKGLPSTNNNNKSKQYVQLQFDISLRLEAAFIQLSKVEHELPGNMARYKGLTGNQKNTCIHLCMYIPPKPNPTPQCS